MAVKNLEQHVAQFLQRYSTPGQVLGVAVSGGADSSVLLHILAALLPRESLRALHVNHGLRGAESDADQELVAELAKNLQVAFDVFPGPPGRGNLEAEARRVRYQLFEAARRKHGLGGIAIGHTASDQAETVLFRILRGTGPTGLGGMPRRSALGILRPLLEITREEIRLYAAAHNIPFRDDLTNRDLRFRRNRLRLETLPLLARQFNPRIEGALVQLAEIVRAEEADKARYVRRLLNERTRPASIGGWQLDLRGFDRFSLAMQRRLIRGVLKRVRPSLSSIGFEHVEEVRSVALSADGHGRLQLPGLDILRSFDQMLVASPEVLQYPREYEFAIDVNQAVVLPYGAGSVHVTGAPWNRENCDNVKAEEACNSKSGLVDLTAMRLHPRGAPFTLRNWRPGDSISVSEGRPAEKIKCLFQEHRIPLWERRHWPVLLAGNTVLWARKFGVAAAMAAGSSAREIVQVEWRAF